MPDSNGAVTLASALALQQSQQTVGPCEEAYWYAGYNIPGGIAGVSAVAAIFNRASLTLCGQPNATTRTGIFVWIGITDWSETDSNGAPIRYIQTGHAVYRSRFVPNDPTVYTSMYIETKAGPLPSQYNIDYRPAVSGNPARWTIESVSASSGWYVFTYDGTILLQYLAGGWVNRYGTRGDFILETHSWGNLMGGTAGNGTRFSSCEIGYNGAPLVASFFDQTTSVNDLPSEWRNALLDQSSFEVWDTVP